jgi:predicted Fe-S protein YdhL (DUF1289 family)
MTRDESPIEFPSTKVCVVHPTQSLCIGCGPSLEEIARRVDFDDAARARIMTELPARLKALSGAAAATT